MSNATDPMMKEHLTEAERATVVRLIAAAIPPDSTPEERADFIKQLIAPYQNLAYNAQALVTELTKLLEQKS